jgi:hypothetical protein
MTIAPTHAELVAAIEGMGRRYLAEGRAPSLYEINNGQCEDFASEVADALGGERDGFEAFWADNLTVDGEGGEWDVALVERLWPLCVPTHDLSWDDVLTDIPAHYWLVLDGRHYDAECPEGVDNLFDLPLVRRRVERIAEAREPAPALRV